MSATTDHAEVWQRVLQMYRLAEKGDSTSVDRLLHEQATFWDTDEPQLVQGLDELRVIRSARPDPGADDAFEIEARDPVIDVFAGLALVRHVFRVRKGGTDSWSFVRNTSAWQRSAEGWVLVHNHEDVLGDAAVVGSWAQPARPQGSG